MLQNLKDAIDKEYASQTDAAEAMTLKDDKNPYNTGNLSNLINTKDYTSSFKKPTIIRLEKAFPQYNIDWLLYNKGPRYANLTPIKEITITEPLHSTVSKIENALEIGELTYHDESDVETPFIDLKNGQYIMLVPLVEAYAHAGYLEHIQDKEYVKDLPVHSFVVTRHHRGSYYAFRVVGDSMDNGTIESIPEGSVVTGRDIGKQLWTSRFHINAYKDYVICHKEGLLIKRIKAHNVEDGIITCESLNEDKDKYPDFDLNLDDCMQILNIVNVTHIK